MGFDIAALKMPVFADSKGVAKIKLIRGDGHYQPFKEQNWRAAKIESDIFQGDAVYSGKSTDIEVEMKSGGQLALGEETLIVFNPIDGGTIPDLSRGSIRLRVFGDMKASLSGDVFQFSADEGGESEFLISLGESGMGRIQVLSGRPKIKSPKRSAKRFGPGSSIDFTASDHRTRSLKQINIPKDVMPLPSRTTFEPISNIGPQPALHSKTLPAPVLEKPTPSRPLTEIFHTLSKSDLYYPLKGIKLAKRTRLNFVEAPGVLSWTGGDGKKTYVQVTKVKRNGEFEFGDSWYSDIVTGHDVVLTKWRPGAHVWRVSMDGKDWSQPAEVKFNVRYEIAREPSIQVANPEVRFPNPRVQMRLKDNSGRKMSGWIVEGSRDQSFGKSISVWVESPNITVPLKTVGNYYFRVRSVDEQGEISAFSEVQSVKVLRENVPIQMAKTPMKKDPVREIATRQQNDEPIVRSKTHSRNTEQVKPFVKEGPWFFALLGGVGAVISGDQADQGISPPILHVLGFGAGYFNRRYEVKFNYRTRIGVTGGVGGAPSVSRLDVRGGHWWNLGWRPFKSSIRLGFMIGYKNYQNTDSRNFASSYEVAKSGLGVSIDVTERIQTGGTVLFGKWMNSNSVIEVDGHLAYDLLENLNLGIGYRVGLFEAGAMSSTPSILPYREATGEAYSQLKFAF